jgi:hypothetical protein
MIVELISRLDDKRAKPIQAWDTDKRPEEEKSKRPRAPVPC